MVKFLIITFLILFVLFKLFGFLFRALFFTLSSRQQQQKRTGNPFFRKRPPEGNVDIEYNPTENGRKGVKTFKGGEYVDYEEVK